MSVHDVTTSRQLPVAPGVYVVNGTKPDGLLDSTLQLDGDGQWWPYPYLFSGWRTGELLAMGGTYTLLSDVPSDVPEIRDPEVAAQLAALRERLSAAFPEIAAERIEAFARLEVLTENGEAD